MLNFDIKKALFTISGLGIVLLIALFARAYNAHASVKDGEKFENWIAECEKDDKGKQICFLTQSVSSKDSKDEKKVNHVATFRIGYFEKDKNLKMVQILPFGTNLQSGTSIILGKDKLIAPGKFTTCQTFGCIAVAEISKKEMNDLIATSEAYVGVMSVDGKQININLSTKGLKEGFAALK